jgi:hypothetical protein
MVRAVWLSVVDIKRLVREGLVASEARKALLMIFALQLPVGGRDSWSFDDLIASSALHKAQSVAPLAEYMGVKHPPSEDT